MIEIIGLGILVVAIGILALMAILLTLMFVCSEATFEWMTKNDKNDR